MKIEDILMRLLKKSYRLIKNKKFTAPPCDIDRQSANDRIYKLLISDKPCMISRFGTTELITVNNYQCIVSDEDFFKKIWNYITDKTHLPWWDEMHFKFMDIYSGIFPPTKETAEFFSKLYLHDTSFIDLLGSFQYYEKFMPLREDVQKVHLETLYPFFVERPWTRALKGKKVLIIHPFKETILEQYKIKDKLFDNCDILPEFELIVYRSIQSAGGIKVPYDNWFKALEYMEDEVSKIDFDICILGCGAYGLPLAAHIKRMGKKAFHIGGGLQLLFGIKGKRWDKTSYGYEYGMPELFKKSYCSLYNSYWTKPFKINTPNEASDIDGAVYW